jgi:hypothetical protein
MKIALATWLTAAMSLSNFACGNEKPDQLPELLARTKASIATECAGYRATLEKANTPPFALEQARDGIDVTCSCFPQELDEQSRASQNAGQTPEQQALGLARSALETCVVRRIRSQWPEACRKDPKRPADPKAAEQYCSCVEARMSKLTDQEIVSRSQRSRELFEARLSAIRKKDPAPPLAPGPFDEIETACRAGR